MSKIVTLVSPTDNSTVQFVEEDPMQGGVKDVYFAPDRSYVVAFYRKKLDVEGRERLEKLVDAYRRNLFENEGGDYYRDLFRWPEKLVEYDGRTGIVVPLYDSKFFFPEGTTLEGAEKEGYWFTSAKNFNRSVPDTEKGDLLLYIQVCVSLSRAVKRLHAAGLAHSDLSYKNCLVDPSSGSSCIIDIDGLVVPGLFPPDVVGTPDFIAPEVVETLKLDRHDPAKRLPCISTDQHALAVLIYLYLLHRHPLRGSKVWDHEDQERQESLEMGEKALFIEHPTDRTNRRIVGQDDGAFLPWIDTDKLPFTILGPYLKELFLSAFVENLHQPSLRPTADDWEEALIKTRDILEPCLNKSCPKGWYVYDGTGKPVCPYCGTPYSLPSVPVLDFYSTRDGVKYLPDRHRLTVYNNQYLYPWHAIRSIRLSERLAQDRMRPVGYFGFHKGSWMFVNQKLTSMRDYTTKSPVPVGSGVKLENGQRLLFSTDTNGRMAVVTMINC
jgi:serine/threonine protein kinase